MHHCGRFATPPTTRREMLRHCAGGFGAVALAALMSDGAYGADAKSPPTAGSDVHRPPHHQPRARSVIFLFMEGGPSQVDTFDPKPRLDREHGQPLRMQAPPTQFIPHNAVPRVCETDAAGDYVCGFASGGHSAAE